jgi:hypothetical protein
MVVYKKHIQIVTLNPRAQLVRVKTDSIGYIGIDTEIETNDHEWGHIKREWVPPKPNKLIDESKFIRTTEYKVNCKYWNIYKREVFDDEDIKAIIKLGGLIFSMAGAGKSTTLKKSKKRCLKILT